MMWNVNDREFESVSTLPAEQRYAYFIKRVADWEQVWSLAAQHGWALAGDDDGHELVPVWPHERFAAVCAIDEWAGYEPRPIDLSTWLERWTPGLIRDRRLVAVFPTPGKKGICVDAAQLRDDLEQELSLIE